MGLDIAFFGQAAFGRDVLRRLLEAGHRVVGVYAPPEGPRPDPLADEALARGLPLLRVRAMRRKGRPIASRVEEHARLGAELNVLAFVTMILPELVLEAPRYGSLCFHPSLLPRFRGGNALAWQILLGEEESGVTVFRPDAGVDRGPIVVQKGGVRIRPTHTAASLYFGELYPLGVEALCEAVDLVERGEAVYRPQDESRATFQGLVTDEVAHIDWQSPAQQVDRQLRGCDPSPGAWTRFQGEVLRLFSGRLLPGAPQPDALPGSVVAAQEGQVQIAGRGGLLEVGRVRREGGPKIPAAELLAVGERLR